MTKFALNPITGLLDLIGIGDGTIVPVGEGGTGRAALTAHTVIIGEGTSPVGMAGPGTDNTALLGHTGADPSFAAVPNATLEHSSITFTAGPGISLSGSSISLGGSLTISSTDAIAAYKNITTAMSPYTVLAGDEFLSCDSTAGAITLLFPNTTTASRNFIIKDRVGNAATNNITITTVGGSVTIDGQTSYVFSDNFESLEMIFNGTTYEGY